MRVLYGSYQMNSKKDYAAPRVQSLSIHEWHALGEQGTALPVTICLEGDSMRPLIRRGKDPVTIIPLSRPLKIGDVVLFRGGPERFVVHRVYKLKDGFVQTLGDNCYNPDPWMPLENVWGLVIRYTRDGKTYPLDTDQARRRGRIRMKIHPVRIFIKRGINLLKRIVRKMLKKLGVKRFQ